MSKVFRLWKTDEVWLLPPSVADFVPAGHPTHLIRDLVSEGLDLSAILGANPEMKGCPPYHRKRQPTPTFHGFDVTCDTIGPEQNVGIGENGRGVIRGA